MTSSYVGTTAEVVTEALTGEHVGRVLSREIELNSQVPRCFLEQKVISDVREGEVLWELER